MENFFSIDDVISYIENNNTNMVVRKIKNKQTIIYVAYLPYITTKDKLTEEIIKPLMQYQNTISSAKQIGESVIYTSDLSIDNDFSKVLGYLRLGKSIIGISHESTYIVADTGGVAQRNVSAPEVQYALRAPKDSFVENLDTNLSLISYRIKDSHLCFKNFIVGTRTQTRVVVAYLDNLADKNVVKYVEDTISNITIDGILESSYIQKILNGKSRKILPNVSIAERSDKACSTILKGRLCVLVEGSNLALMLPERFMDFLDSGDDHYGTVLLGPFNTSLRIFGIISTYSLPALYLVVTSFNPDMLPASYLLSIASARSAVPLNAVLEIFFMTIVIEMLREASIRLPTKIGSAIGIVGGIVIGQGAIAAGLTSPISIVIVSFSSISSFLLPDYNIVTPLNVLKFILIMITGVLGLFGFLIGLSFLAVHIISQRSFGVPYAEPIAPFTPCELKDQFLPQLQFYKEGDSNATNPNSPANSTGDNNGNDDTNITTKNDNKKHNADKDNTSDKNNNNTNINKDEASKNYTKDNDSNSNYTNSTDSKNPSNNNDKNTRNTNYVDSKDQSGNNENNEQDKPNGIFKRILSFFKDDTDDNNDNDNNDANTANVEDNNTNTSSSDNTNNDNTNDSDSDNNNMESSSSKSSNNSSNSSGNSSNSGTSSGMSGSTGGGK